jgi:hypothetical protein
MALCLLACYGMLYFPVRRIAGRIFGPTTAVAAAVGIAVAAGGVLLSLEPWAHPPAVEIEGEGALKPMLDADDAAVRIAGLTYLYQRKLDIGEFRDPSKMARSPDPRERYWLARVLSVSRNPDTFPILLTLLDDPQINVAYQACRALGQRKDRRGVDALLKSIGRSREWYVQLYAYRALRRLGWHQKGSG